MKSTVKLPRILKINSINGFTIECIFNNGETRIIDFAGLFKKWKLKPGDPEYVLTNEKEFRKVSLRNKTLSWKNVKIGLVDMDGNETIHPFEVSPDVLYKNSKPAATSGNRYFFGERIRKLRLGKGMTQDELAEASGTSKTYISRVENNLIEPELSTLYKIIEIGLGKRISIRIK